MKAFASKDNLIKKTACVNLCIFPSFNSISQFSKINTSQYLVYKFVHIFFFLREQYIIPKHENITWMSGTDEWRENPNNKNDICCFFHVLLFCLAVGKKVNREMFHINIFSIV